MGAIFQSLGRTISAGVVLVDVGDAAALAEDEPPSRRLPG